MGITVCCSNKQFILIYSIFFIRMKSTLCPTVLCSYLALSAASAIPDKKDLENDAGLDDNYPNRPGYGGLASFDLADADRASHDATEPDYGADEFWLNSENGFQPESSALPVAPQLPHPIPQFRID